ncbi:M28 family metallopeptidase [Polyangium jinanense]|uniref:M28 family peptidase n=1 Tax=Polyangium jinanense TaxID=2829994 RepID=A0A9X3X7N7_9BACT|nr:M28 family peptidase [Polyangium jinanense]MDC3961092.1 M28 family peptidase [Polyangium jinanense]MDC3982831.1 M28 family peptidase [Polyangium jinanense]
MTTEMRKLVEELCSPACAGRKPGTKGGDAARAAVVSALRKAGLDPHEQPVPGLHGANVIAVLPGDVERYVLVGAHFDHLGELAGQVFWGADDNAAAVGILLEVARALAAERPTGRGVILAAFDGEEPPHFTHDTMGSVFFAKHPPVPLDRIDMMSAMDLVGHTFGPAGVPDEVGASLFALGAERSEGTAAHVDSIATSEPLVRIRRADAEVIPPLSDHLAFWQRGVPFLFLTSGRSRHYHTPTDTPEKLDWPKMAATARWLERFVRETCARPPGPIPFLRHGRDDAATLRSFITITTALEPVSAEASAARETAEELLAQCDERGALPDPLRSHASMLVGMLESKLA